MAHQSRTRVDARALYPTVAPALVRSCTRLLGNRADAEDVVQQLFVDLIHRGRTDLDLPYLHRAATNRSLNRIRDHKRHHGVRTGKLTPSQFVAVTSTNTARIFNIWPKKGTLQPGADADIVVWDPNKTRTISVDTHHQNIDFNIYEGMEITGNAAVTLSRGQVVWQDDQLRTTRGRGKYVDRPPFAFFWDAQEKRNALATPTKVDRG